jgi:hypothetical protein
MQLLSFITGALFYTGGKFSNLDNFILKLSHYMDDIDINNQEEAFLHINDIITNTKFKVSNKQIGEDEALLLLMCDEIENIINKQYNFQIEFNIEKELERNYFKFLRLYQDIGININNDIPYFIVNDYPSPYNHLKGAALCPDKSDQIKFNITPGIYFRGNKIIPVQSALTLAHEMIHFIIGKQDHHLLARGLEEGICEFLGVAFCGHKIFGNQVPLNYFIHRRLKYSGHKQKFKLYMDYFRTATYLYLKYGMDAIVSLVNSGRGKIKEIEISLTNMTNEINSFSPCREIPEGDLIRLSCYISMIYPEDEVVSPLSYWISQNINGLTSIKQIIQDLNIEPKQGQKAIEELEKRLFALLLDNDLIEYSDLETILKLKSYRYEV